MAIATHRNERLDAPRLSRNALKIALFGCNEAGGLAATKVPERWVPSWENNFELARLGEEAGIDFMVAGARWKGYGGVSGFHDTTLESSVWAAAILARTTEITAFSTVHTAFVHPIVAAKQLATIDQMSGGRVALNIVSGWNKPEYDMFGLEIPNDHAIRYGITDEWWDVIRRLWTEDENFDFDGNHFQLKAVSGKPKPTGNRLPLVMNAGASEQGRDFASRHADYFFTSLVFLEKAAADVAASRAFAKERHGRDLEIFTTCHIIVRPTDEEAQAYYQYYAGDEADWPAVDTMMHNLGIHSHSYPPEAYQLFRERFAGGHGTFPIVGSPDTVANTLEQISQAGFAGVAVSFVNYLDEFPLFRDEVLPRLVKKGIRAV